MSATRAAKTRGGPRCPRCKGKHGCLIDTRDIELTERAVAFFHVRLWDFKPCQRATVFTAEAILAVSWPKRYIVKRRSATIALPISA